MQIANPIVPRRCIDQVHLQSVIPDAFDHRNDRLVNKTLHELRTGLIDIHHLGLNPHLGEPSVCYQWE